MARENWNHNNDDLVLIIRPHGQQDKIIEVLRELVRVADADNPAPLAEQYLAMVQAKAMLAQLDKEQPK